MSSNFNFYVNRQGVQGQRGAKGEQGFSPVISVESQTANEYILKVENEDGSFTTPNLRGNAIENNGGTYIRFNPETEQMYTGFADSATTEQAGVVRMGTYEDLVAGESEELVPNVADVHDFVQNSIGDISGFVTTSDFNAYTSETASTLNDLSTNKLDASTFNSYTTATDVAIGALDTNKLDFTDLANTLVQGENVTLTTDAVNKTITVSSSGGGGGTQVQSNWAETDDTNPSFIQNKPAIPAAQVQSDWNQSDNTAVDFIKNKPTIPAAANDATITITQGGVAKGSFTTNQSTNATIDIDAGSGSSLLAGNGIDINANDEIDIMQVDETEADGYNWDFDTVGTLTENNGVYSGFSDSNYLSSKTAFEANLYANSLEIEINFTTGATLPSGNLNQYLFCVTPNNYHYPAIALKNNRIMFLFSTNGSDTESIEASDITILANTNYTVHIEYSNNSLTGTLTNNDNQSVINLTSSTPSQIHITREYPAYFWLGRMGNSSSSYIAPFGGSINTRNSFVKINGVMLQDITEHQSIIKPCAKATSSLYGLVKPDGSTTQVTNGVISTVNTVQSSTVTNIVQITQADYDALVTKDANTLYVIIPASS